MEATTEIINSHPLFASAPTVCMLAVQLLRRLGWPPLAKALVAIIVSGIFAIAQSWISGDLGALVNDWDALTATRLTAYWALICASGQAIHNTIGGSSLMAKLGEWPDRES